MKTMGKTFAGMGLFLLLAGCGAKSMVVLLPDPDGKVGQVVVANQGGEQVLNQANQSVQVTDRQTRPSAVSTLSAEEINATFSEVLAARPLPPARFMLYFLQDSTELTAESKAVLLQIFQDLQKRGASDIVITGHADKVGEDEYNYQLALERAQTTSHLLSAKGAAPAKLYVASHGEVDPLVNTADEVAEPRNRRVEVVIK